MKYRGDRNLQMLEGVTRAWHEDGISGSWFMVQVISGSRFMVNG